MSTGCSRVSYGAYHDNYKSPLGLLAGTCPNVSSSLTSVYVVLLKYQNTTAEALQKVHLIPNVLSLLSNVTNHAHLEVCASYTMVLREQHWKMGLQEGR